MARTTVRKRIPFHIQNEEELRGLWADFKEYMLEGISGHVPANQKVRLTGAGLFVDFLCGIAPKKTSQTSYLKYPEEPWPID